MNTLVRVLESQSVDKPYFVSNPLTFLFTRAQISHLNLGCSPPLLSQALANSFASLLIGLVSSTTLMKSKRAQTQPVV